MKRAKTRYITAFNLILVFFLLAVFITDIFWKLSVTLNITGTFIALILLAIFESLFFIIRDKSERSQIKEYILKSKIKRAVEPSIYLELIALFTLGILGIYTIFTTINQSEFLFYFTIFFSFILIPINAPRFLAKLRKNRNIKTRRIHYFVLSSLMIIMFIIIFSINYGSSANSLLYDGAIWVLAIIMTSAAEYLPNII